MGKKRKAGKGKTAKKAKVGSLGVGAHEEEHKKAPHTFVISRGHVGKNVNDLVRDTRRVMEPYTASKLKVRKKNVLKDFISIAGPLNVSHFIMFSKTETGINMRIMRLPRGPTLTFRLNSYSLARDIISSLKRPNMEQKQFKHHPLLVMNSFSGEGMQLKLMATMFQNMFPSINVNKVKLNEIRRCVLLNYNPEEETLDFRHYNVRAVPVGMSRGVKKLIKAKIPNMGRYDDVSEYLTKGGDLSESEAELDGPHNEVVLPQQLAGRGNIQAAKSAIRLTEIGPRMTLQLVKIEEGLCDGEVLYHQFIQKSEEELQLLREMRAEKRRLKQQRKKEQEGNIMKKDSAKQANKERALAGMKRRAAEEEEEDSEVEDPGGAGDANMEDDMDDEEYFRQEVGEKPDPELFPASHKKKKGFGKDKPYAPYKKRKFDPQQNAKQRHSGEKSMGQKDRTFTKQDKEKKPETILEQLQRKKKKKEKDKAKGRKPKRSFVAKQMKKKQQQSKSKSK